MTGDDAAIISVQAQNISPPSRGRETTNVLPSVFFGHPTQHRAVKRLDIHLGGGSGCIVNGGLFYIWLRTLPVQDVCLILITSLLDIGCFIVCPPIGTLNAPIRSCSHFDMICLT